MSVTYRLARPHTVGLLGRLLVGCGVLVLGVLLVALLVEDLSTAWTVLLAVPLVAVLLPTAVAAVRVLRPPVLLVSNEAGYRLRGVRGAGVLAASWTDVRRVRRERLAAGPCLVLSLADGRRTVVPLRLLDGGAAAADRLESDLAGRLDRAHGQRPLR